MGQTYLVRALAYLSHIESLGEAETQVSWDREVSMIAGDIYVRLLWLVVFGGQPLPGEDDSTPLSIPLGMVRELELEK